MMPTEFTPMLTALCRERGVRAAAAVTADDGTLIDFVLRVGDEGEQVAALAASLYRKARRSAHAAGMGTTTLLHLEAEAGRLFVIGEGQVLIIAVTEPAVNIGAVRVAMRAALAGLAA
jgi:predicted regulator of Ras-like GTPase activity (Roadblock/LC7/MglB family)